MTVTDPLKQVVGAPKRARQSGTVADLPRVYLATGGGGCSESIDLSGDSDADAYPMVEMDTMLAGSAMVALSVPGIGYELGPTGHRFLRAASTSWSRLGVSRLIRMACGDGQTEFGACFSGLGQPISLLTGGVVSSFTWVNG